MLYGIKLFLISIILIFFKDNIVYKSVEIISIVDNVINIKLEGFSTSSVSCYVNSNIRRVNDNVINVFTSEIKPSGALILLKTNSSSFKLILTATNGENEILVNDYEYHIGYYLKSESNDIRVINNFSNDIRFSDIEFKKYIIDASSFSLNIFPSITLSKKEFIKGELILFINEGVFPYLKYQECFYKFNLDFIDSDNFYNIILSKGYKDFSNSIIEDTKGSLKDLFLPINYNEKIFSATLKITISNVVFVLNYDINMSYTYENNVLINIVERKEHCEYEKELFSFYG